MIKIDSPAFDIAHYKRLEQYAQNMEQLYLFATREAAQLGASISFNPDKPFSFKDYPQTYERAKNLFNSLGENIETNISKAVKKEWEHAQIKNDEIVDKIAQSSRLTPEILSKYKSRNTEALAAFQSRKINGMGLSDRVWKMTEQFKQEIEMGLDIGLGEGKSAASVSRDLRTYLNDPEMLFRRVRDKHGNLHLSKNAKAYHPGQGVYRSSYKNAMRLTRTEVNMAYRASDYDRWQGMDFIVGVEIKTSNNHTLNGQPFSDICDNLKGRYPKDFKFSGWHPQCKCHAVPIFMTEEEFEQGTEQILDGNDPDGKSVNGVNDYPDNFINWVEKNKSKIDAAAKSGTLPYFLKENMEGGRIKMRPQINNIKEDEQTNNLSVIERIQKKENVIRQNKTFETAIVFDDNGDVVFEKKGEAMSVGLNNAEMIKMKDNIFTHNHPGGWQHPDNSMLRIGNSFSPADVYIAIKADVKEMRAVSPNYTFSIKRPQGGWPIDLRRAKMEIESLDEELTNEFESRIRNRTTTPQKATVIHYHTIWKRFAKKFNLDYSKQKTT